MSASEKLTALFDAASGNNSLVDMIVVWDALPQLIAAVKALEQEHSGPHNYARVGAGGAVVLAKCPACAALAELDEALQ